MYTLGTVGLFRKQDRGPSLLIFIRSFLFIYYQIMYNQRTQLETDYRWIQNCITLLENLVSLNMRNV